MKRRQFQEGALVLLLSATQIARGANIVAVRVWPAADYTRVTIESDRALAHKTQFVPNPPRLAVDIEGLELQPTLRELIAKVRPDDPFIAGLRVAQHAAGIVRIVIDLKQDAAPQVFALTPVAAYQHRLVLDLHPAKPLDPLEALIAEKLAAPRPAPKPTPAPSADPLGDLIAQRTKPALSDANPAIAPAVAATNAQHTSNPAPNSSSAAPTAIASAPKSATAHKPASRPAPAAESEEAVSTDTSRVIVIALDPGHGGEDPGAIGPAGTYEKNVTLSIALKLRDRINAASVTVGPRGARQQLAMRAFLTRRGDYFVPLAERVRKARRVQADLFISIHADAFTRPEARGASVFALSTRGASSAMARFMADKENAADAVGGINTSTKDKALAQALLDMSTTAQISDSLKLGTGFLGEIGAFAKLHKPRVEQAGFAVLKAPDIPSVLVETAFISNPEEEQLLASDAYQTKLADALMRGILRYFARNPPLARSRST